MFPKGGDQPCLFWFAWQPLPITVPDTLEARDKFLHQVYILDLEGGRLSRQPVLGDAGEAEAGREGTEPKVKSGCRRM